MLQKKLLQGSICPVQVSFLMLSGCKFSYVTAELNPIDLNNQTRVFQRDDNPEHVKAVWLILARRVT
jgi:hypothetical protein